MKKKRNVIQVGAAILAGGILLAGAYIGVTAKPVVELRGDEAVTVEVFDRYKEAGVHASFLKFYEMTDQIQVSSDLDTDKVGEYTVHYLADFHGRKTEALRTVKVVDTKPPVLTRAEGTSIILGDINDEVTGVTAVDNYDGDLTKQIEEKREQLSDTKGKITYEVKDSSGNAASLVIDVEIKDLIPPEIALVGEETLTVAYKGVFVDPGATATDNKDGDLTAAIQTEDEIDTSVPGEQTITYVVKDAAGNEAKVTRTVKVLKAEEKNPNAIYLTFDDGPSDVVTPQILDTLKKNHIKATFFILNYSDANKALVKRAIDEGHTIGIHGYSHDYGTIYASEEAFMNNVEKLAKRLRDDFGYEPFVLRFPGGSSNMVSKKYSEGIMTKLVKTVSGAGYEYLDWNVDSQDATGNNVDTEKLYGSVTGSLKKNRGNVVLMHDTNRKETTAEVLQRIIDYGNENGYSFYAFSKGTAAVHHSVNN